MKPLRNVVRPPLSFSISGLNIFLRILFKHLHTVNVPPKRQQLPNSLFSANNRGDQNHRPKGVENSIPALWIAIGTCHFRFECRPAHRAISDLNVGRHTDSPDGFRGFLQTLQSNIGTVPKIGYFFFFRNIFNIFFCFYPTIRIYRCRWSQLLIGHINNK